MAKRSARTGTPGGGSRKNQPADAIQMLEADHRKVEQLFNDFLEGDAGHQQQIAQEIFRGIEVHSILEEELFYPALQDQGLLLISGSLDKHATNGIDVLTEDERAGDGIDAEIYSEEEEVDKGDRDLSEDTIASAYDDHRMIRDQIVRLRRMDTSAPEFRQTMIDLQDMVADHVSIEEDELFPEARLSLDIKMLGRQMKERKADILSEAA